MITEQAYNILKTRYKVIFDELSISDVRIGKFLTAIRLSDGSTGTASSLEDNHPFCSKADREFGDFTPMNIRGQKVRDLLEVKKVSALVSSLKAATLNAISAGIISSGKYKVIENCDPILLLSLDTPKTITIVGAFQSYIQKIQHTGSRLFVLELNETALQPGQKKFYVPADEYSRVIPISDIVLITGQTLVNGTIDNLLSSVKKGTQVIVTGPSGSILPDVLFENGVSIIGAIRLLDPGLVFDIVGEAGMAYHLFEYGVAQKICILKENGQATE